MSKAFPTGTPQTFRPRASAGWDYRHQRPPREPSADCTLFTPLGTAAGWRDTQPRHAEAMREWLAHLEAGRIGGG